MTLDRFFKRKTSLPHLELSSPSIRVADDSKRSRIDININDLESDPARRRRIMDYDANIRDEVRRSYALKGPCQPRGHDFPQKMIGTSSRRFKATWFDLYGSWLEYSVSNYAAYCLCCYLFKQDISGQSGGDTFVTRWFSNWKHNTTFKDHVGVVNSVHLQAMSKYQDLLNQKQNIQSIFFKQSNEAKSDYRIRLNASIDTVELIALADQLENYIVDMRSHSAFSNLKGISDLSKQLVAYKKDKDYVLVYRLLTLALILPVATASVERVFSAMKIVKNYLRNRMRDEWTNDAFVVYIENEIFDRIGNEAITQHFQNMATRRGQL